jgi:hypothetical protein
VFGHDLTTSPPPRDVGTGDTHSNPSRTPERPGAFLKRISSPERTPFAATSRELAMTSWTKNLTNPLAAIDPKPQ